MNRERYGIVCVTGILIHIMYKIKKAYTADWLKSPVIIFNALKLIGFSLRKGNFTTLSVGITALVNLKFIHSQLCSNIN